MTFPVVCECLVQGEPNVKVRSNGGTERTKTFVDGEPVGGPDSFVYERGIRREPTCPFFRKGTVSE